MVTKKRVLAGSPVYQKPEILSEFLNSLSAQNQNTLSIDYLFLVDSDLVLHPNLAEHLKSLQKEVVSEVFWCSWHTGTPELPNVWMFDEYDFFPVNKNSTLSENDVAILNTKFLDMLRVPGTYEVGGLGACTLISRFALEKGVNFTPIKNLTIHGEDRFFCIRAAVLDIELFADTRYPAYHIYRDSDLAGLPAFTAACHADGEFSGSRKTRGNKLTLSMTVHNESGRYLKQLLESLREHIDSAVIIDDASTDGTAELCDEVLRGVPLHILRNEQSMFGSESELRQRQWNETVKTDPDWILSLDADEIPEDGFWADIQAFLDDTRFDVYNFRLYDMWNSTQYREDKYWQAHKTHRPFLLRYLPGFEYEFNDKPQHCGRFPMNIPLQHGKNTDYRIKHYGWATEKDRIAKKDRYALLDPDAIYGVKQQYASISDLSPVLKDFRV